jgi:hypothetical protein
MPFMTDYVQQGFTATLWRAPVTPRLLRVVITVMLLVMPPVAYGFGARAHQIVGYVAENYICEDARRAIFQLTADSSLADAGVWADQIRSNPAWDAARPWHYINVPDGVLITAATRQSSGDVLTAIDRFIAELQDTSLPDEQRQLAFNFLVHFVADVHQPLHVGRRADRGGNTVKIRFNQEKSNLHSYWDSGVLDSVSLGSALYAARLVAASGDMRVERQVSDPLVWAAESMALRPEVYALGAPDKSGRVLLNAHYQGRALKIVNLRMAQAGIRLAGQLNSIWCPE